LVLLIDPPHLLQEQEVEAIGKLGPMPTPTVGAMAPTPLAKAA